MEKTMSEVTLFGFPHSSFVHIAQLVLMHKEVPYTFHDLEPDMGSPKHLALHPFDRVPILQHGDFVLYETSAIVAYLEELFPTPSLEPDTPQDRARMHQWISAVKFLLLPVHDLSRRARAERVPSARYPVRREGRGACRCPRSRSGCRSWNGSCRTVRGSLLGGEVTLADYYLLPSTLFVRAHPGGQDDVRELPVVQAWRERMEALPTVQQLRRATADLPPIEHARKWAVSHRPKY
jgi:glutathione S-transferase